VFLALLFICGTITGIVRAQSSRPGWGATPYHDASGTGVTFRVWAPDATSVYVPGQFNSWNTTTNPLTQETTNGSLDGVWSADVTNAVNNQQYKFYLTAYGTNFYKHDPRARWVTNPGSGNNDIIYDPTVFSWNGDDFTNPPQSDLFIYEMHIGTFYTAGLLSKFLEATNKLPYLKSLGVNAVELMPIMEFGNSGSSWGYDPAQPFAVDNVQYGGPNGLKTFVAACHRFGLAVFLDIVQNHYGPNDLDMWNFDGWTGSNSLGGGGIYFYESNTNWQITPYGDTRPNCNTNQVCNYIQDNFTEWLSEYHVDGFRWDTPNTMTHGNDGSYIPAAGNLVASINDMIHTNYTGKISIAEDVYDFWGFDSAWDTSYPYTVTPVLTNTVDADREMNTIVDSILDNVRYGGTANSNRVVFLESHDVVGDLNPGSKRLVRAIDPVTPSSYRARKLSTLGAAVTLTAPGIPMIFQGQEMLESNAFDSATNVDWSKTNTFSGIVQLYRDLIGARRDLKGYTPGLEGDQCAILWNDNSAKLIAFHRWKSGQTNQDAVVIGNFADVNYASYSLTFPWDGTWYVHFNSDLTNYSSDFGNNGSTVVTATGNPPTASVAIGPYSALILSPTPDAAPQLAAASSSNGNPTISWPLTYSEWTLYQNPSLSSTGWTQVPASQCQTNGSTISYTVIPNNGTYFYELEKQ
jgi:1,4-alpha-glucan branching enzyme